MEPWGGATSDSTQRHISCSMTSILLRTVRMRAGEAGVTEMIARAGDVPEVAMLENHDNWVSLDQAVALLQAGIDVTGDPALARHVGAEAVRQHAGTQVATLLRSLGSPEAVLHGITTTAAKFSTVTDMEAIETSSCHAVVRAVAREGFTRHPLLCDWATGLLSTPCMLFGLPPAHVEEVECQARGGSECRYIVSWDEQLAAAAADPEQRVTALEAQVSALSQRLEGAYATASDLISPDDLDTVLARIVERAADAVRAPGYVLAVRTDEDAELSVFSDGVSPVEATRIATTVADAGSEPEGMLCVEVASSHRDYGRLFALHPSENSFFPQERQLLILYARHAAAVLDTAMTLRDAARKHAHVSALLSLSQQTARATSTKEVARTVTDAVLDVVGCDQASTWLWHRDSRTMRREATAGAFVEGRRNVLGLDDTPYLAQMLEDPAPMFFELGERDPVMAAFVSDAGLVALAAVPIIAQDTLMALLAVGVKRDPERLRRSPELIEKLNGVAALAAPALQNRHLLDELHHQVLHDALTGVLNRTGFGRSLERILAGDQGPMPQAGLLFLDVDGFKALNDEHGHHVGDRLLCEVSERLRQTLRGDDRVARLGGDEFAVVLPRVHSPEEVHIAANRVHDAFAKPFRIEDMLVTVRVSVGEAVAPQDGTTIEELVRRADAAMYRQKALQRSELLRRHSTA